MPIESQQSWDKELLLDILIILNCRCFNFQQLNILYYIYIGTYWFLLK